MFPQDSWLAVSVGVPVVMELALPARGRTLTRPSGTPLNSPTQSSSHNPPHGSEEGNLFLEKRALPSTMCQAVPYGSYLPTNNNDSTTSNVPPKHDDDAARTTMTIYAAVRWNKLCLLLGMEIEIVSAQVQAVLIDEIVFFLKKMLVL